MLIIPNSSIKKKQFKILTIPYYQKVTENSVFEIRMCLKRILKSANFENETMS